MNKVLIAIALLFLCTVVRGQRLWLMEGDTTLVTSQAMIDFSASAGWESNSIDRAMVNHLAFGGYIERDLIDRQASRMNEFLRFGGGYDGTLRFWLFRDSVLRATNWAWQGQVQSRAHLGVGAPADAYNLVFKGNDPHFLGQTARFDETWVDYMAYQKFGFGMVHKPTLSGFVVSAVNGQEFDRVYINRGGFFTSADADSIAVNAFGDRFTSEAGGRFGGGYGIGMAIDGVFNLPLKDQMGFVSIGVQDFGFITWNESSRHTSLDTTWSFTGVDISELITDGTAAFPQVNDTLLTTAETGSLSRWLPGFVYTRLLHKIGERDFFEVTMVFRPINAFLPLFSAGYHHRLNGRSLVGATAMYGGYGGVRFGVSAEKWFGNQWFAAITTDDVYSLISNRGRAMQAGLRLTYVLKRHDR